MGNESVDSRRELVENCVHDTTVASRRRRRYVLGLRTADIAWDETNDEDDDAADDADDDDDDDDDESLWLMFAR